MPGFDGTGPVGRGSMTGRGMGYCIGVGRRGYGVGVGRGFGRGRGRGMAYGRGMFGRQVPQWYGEDSPAYRKEWLQGEIEAVEEYLNDLKQQQALDNKKE